jgi:S1/P1 Nuclease
MWKAMVLVVALACCAPPSYGWGEEGHRVIVRIAESRVTPAVAAQIQATLNPGESLEDLASWADEIRQSRPETASWHFVDIPLNSAGLDMSRDCPQGNCVVAKIEEFRSQWQNPALSQAKRREALLFLVHFVGDLHQPLHCENNNDKGGNEVPVEFLGSHTNLHGLWDSGLFRTLPGEDELLATLEQAITPDRAAAWWSGTVEQWAGESFALAQSTAYGLLPTVGKGETVSLDSWYSLMAQPVVEEQLEKAGFRLAAILNTKAQ